MIISNHCYKYNDIPRCYTKGRGVEVEGSKGLQNYTTLQKVEYIEYVVHIPENTNVKEYHFIIITLFFVHINDRG